MIWILLCAVLNAPTVVEFELLPPGREGQIQGVGQARCYLLEEYLELNVFDKELVKLHLDLQDLKDINIELESQLKEKDRIIATLGNDKDILAKRGMRLEESLHKCEKENLEAASSPIWPYTVALTGVVIGIVSMGMWLHSEIHYFH